MNEDAVRALEQEILGDRVAFPCGCVLEWACSYPGRDWKHTGRALHPCSDHPGTAYHSSPSSFVATAGPLEYKWLKADGTRVTMDELEAAMREWVCSADENLIGISGRLKERNIKPAPYGTPPVTISFHPSWKEWEEAGVVVEEEKKDGDGRG